MEEIYYGIGYPLYLYYYSYFLPILSLLLLLSPLALPLFLFIPLNPATLDTYQLTLPLLQYLYYYVQLHIVRNTDHKILPASLLSPMSDLVYPVLNQSLALGKVH